VLPEIATDGATDFLALLERLSGVPKLAPPSVERAKKISLFPDVSSCQATRTVLPDIATERRVELPALLERLTGIPKTEPGITVLTVSSPPPHAPNAVTIAAITPTLLMHLVQNLHFMMIIPF